MTRTTARQFEQAIEIVEDEFGADLDNKQAPVVAAVLSALAANYGLRLAGFGKRRDGEALGAY